MEEFRNNILTPLLLSTANDNYHNCSNSEMRHDIILEETEHIYELYLDSEALASQYVLDLVFSWDPLNYPEFSYTNILNTSPNVKKHLYNWALGECNNNYIKTFAEVKECLDFVNKYDMNNSEIKDWIKRIRSSVFDD